MNDDLELIRVFHESCRERLDEMETAVLEMEQRRNCDPSLIDHVFRCVHSLKGDAKTLGHGQVESLSHQMEDVLSGIRSGRLVANRNVIDALLGQIDLIRAALVR